MRMYVGTYRPDENTEVRFGVQIGMPLDWRDDWIDIFFFEATDSTIKVLKDGIPQGMSTLLCLMLEDCRQVGEEGDVDNSGPSLFNFKPGVKIKDSSGFVYILKGLEGQYKIGRTKKITDRVKSIDGTLPFETELVHVIEAGNYKKAEQHLHQKFRDKRIRGEWYDLTEDDIEYIKGITKYG